MIEYSEITEADLDEMIFLYEKYLNSGKYIEDMMKREFYSPDYIGFKACDKGRLVGFFCGQGELGFTYPHAELEKEIRRFAAGRRLYTPDGLLILPDYRKHGIAHELISRMKDRLVENGIELALVELWIYPDGSVPAQKPLNGIGPAIYRKKVPMFYGSIQDYGIECPICGKNCTCGALIEVLDVAGIACTKGV